MSKIKKLTVCFLCFFLFISIGKTVSAQFLELPGIAIGAYNYDYTEDGKTENYKCDELYSFSFTDKILCHSIYTDGYLDESQFYQLSDISKYMNGKITIYKVKATSGLSGKVYSYLIEISEEGKLIKMTRTQPEGEGTDFHGDIIAAKTFKQT